ncbi:hypothetical protein EUGRSUZ_C03232 [Eucalyptus grandis]|uniref:Uncharacterized protein n=2 Tax=Eucalyptus grandis TaxID=71139 RepID=A0ACC3LIY3_EUCGR|nr:hypothetical protein EUGRSUZ_C03232 [Eucalyptus grandis]
MKPRVSDQRTLLSRTLASDGFPRRKQRNLVVPPLWVFLILSNKGISASALPYKRTPLSWLKISSQDVRRFSAAFVCFCGIMDSL